MSGPYYSDELATLLLGDSLDLLTTMPDASVDAVVTDPPYGLGFMAKAWDSDFTPGDSPMRRSAALDAVNAGAARQGGRQRAGLDYQRRMARDSQTFGEWCEVWARECLRVLKLGGYMLAFGGSRTWHRLASAVEDAGFEIRDSIAWLYGSGFPKSLDVSKAIDKAAGAEREVVGRKTGRAALPRTDMRGGNFANPDADRHLDLSAITAPATDDAKRWAGWGTALKPAFEPIVVGRKPLAGTVAANVLTHGTGALNIDACRVGFASAADEAESKNKNRHADFGTAPGGNEVYGDFSMVERTNYDATGRWPTNVVLDDTQAADLDQQTGVLTSGALDRSKITARNGDGWRFNGERSGKSPADSGGASRFFPTFRYEAKAPQSERPRGDDGDAHPTVKPLDLMRWLVRLVTPPGGLVLDPFLGSGTTAEACVVEGFRCIGIEREEPYMRLAVARLSKPIETVLDFGVTA